MTLARIRFALLHPLTAACGALLPRSVCSRGEADVTGRVRCESLSVAHMSEPLAVGPQSLISAGKIQQTPALPAALDATGRIHLSPPDHPVR